MGKRMTDKAEISDQVLELASQMVQLIHQHNPEVDPGDALSMALGMTYSGFVSFHGGTKSTVFTVGICDFVGTMIETAKRAGGTEFEQRFATALKSFIDERPWPSTMNFERARMAPRKEAS